MSRLIDADKLIEDIKINDIGDRIGDGQIDIIKAINRQPTAYDVEKVREQLEELRVNAFNDEVLIINDAIDIVRAGGIDE